MDGPRRLKQHRALPALPKAPATNRPSTSSRGYDRRWQALRLMVLRREPLCRRCSKPAQDVDHIRPMSQGGARLDPSNLQPMCRACHRAKHTEENQNGRIQ